MPTNMTADQGMNAGGQSTPNLGAINPSTGFFSNSILGSGDSGGSQVAQPTDTSTPTDTSASSNWSNLLSGLGSFGSSLLPSASTVTGLAPYLAAAGVGVYQANQAAGQNQQQVNQLTALGKPFQDAGNALLKQGQAGQLTPQQQQVVDLSQQQGQQLIDSAAPLAQIANTGFAQYQAGQLQPGQQQQIDQFTASAKQELRQRLGDSGISDSSILATQDAAIDSQAAQLKANLMSQNLGIADQQFSQWLTTTQAGQQVQQQGKQYAVTSINTMLQQALGFSEAGMAPEEQAVQLAISSNNQLSQSVSQLFQSIMMAYAMNQYQKGGAGAAGGGAGAAGGGAGAKAGSAGGLAGQAAGAVGSGLASIGGVPTSALADQEARMYGGQGDTIASQYQSDQSGGLNFDASFNDGSNGYSLNSDGTVDTSTFQSYFYDPGDANLPPIEWE